MQALQLSIPEPCHENWQQMTPTEQGRFCNACSKEVIDFSTMTDQQVLNYFSRITNEKVCGRVLDSQMEAPIEPAQLPKKKIFWYWNYIVMFFLFFSKSATVKAQKGKIATVQQNDPGCTKTVGQMVSGVKVELAEQMINGRVIDPQGNPVPYAAIRCVNKHLSISADQNGIYQIKARIGGQLIATAAGFSEKAFMVTGIEKQVIQFEQYYLGKAGEVVVTKALCTKRTARKIDPAGTEKSKVEYFEVKDSETLRSLPGVLFMILNETGSTTLSKSSDGNGIMIFVRDPGEKLFHFKVVFPGYETHEFTLIEKDFRERKTTWEIYLKKLPVKQNTIRLGGVSVLKTDEKPLYVLDGIMVSSAENIDPDIIETVTALQGPAAAALYGPAGQYGAIIMVSKQPAFNRPRTLDTVAVKGEEYNRRMGGITGRMVVLRKQSLQTKPVPMQSQGLTVFPNPVQRGKAVQLDLERQSFDRYQLQVLDGVGKVLYQQELNWSGKEGRLNIPVDGRWPAGIFFITLVNSSTKKSQSVSFIVQ
ncbi:MAG: hypothetical protein IPP31_13585 [Chitinophagaceae bacterium]|nr:hypothetical protein [Chitinophagaceae bacterium]